MPVATNAWRNPLVPVACGQQLHIQSSRSSPDAAHLFSRVGRLGGQALLARFHIIQGARLMYLFHILPKEYKYFFDCSGQLDAASTRRSDPFSTFLQPKINNFHRFLLLGRCKHPPNWAKYTFLQRKRFFFFGFLLESKSKR